MSVTLKIDNFAQNNLIQQTMLTADVAVGSSSITVINSSGYNIGDYIVVGGLTSDGSEALKIQSIPDSTTLTTTTAAQLPHTENDSLWSIFGNQIQVYAAANVNGLPPDDTQFAPVGQIINIMVWNSYSVFVDSNPGQFWYKYSFHNSSNGNDTGISSSIAQLSGIVQYCSIFDIREKAGIVNNFYISDAQIEKYRRRAQKEIDNRLQSLYDVPFPYPVNEQIEDIAATLAAGLILAIDNSVFSTGTKGQSNDLLTSARAELAEIDSRVVVLTDANGNPLILDHADSVQGWPDSTTAYLPPSQGGAPRMFTAGHNF